MNGKQFEEVQTMLKDCEVRDNAMTKWETEFVDSLSTRTYESLAKFMTQKQLEILIRIWEKVTAKGPAKLHEVAMGKEALDARVEKLRNTKL